MELKFYFLGEHGEDEYTHEFFKTKEEALEFIKKEKPRGWHGELTERDLEEVEI